MQLFLNGGYYGGVHYFSPETLAMFTSRHELDTRRGIGFDMLQTDEGSSPNLSILASHNTFGHLGFTGISAWVDPDYNLIYLFLSNRTFPSMNNWKLNQEEIRPRIQDVIYRAMVPET